MMYKKYTWMFLFSLLVALCLPIEARASEIEYEDAEVLVIYNNSPTEEEMADIRFLVKTLSYLQHSVVYAPIEEATLILEQYDAVLCYGLEGNLESLMEKLAKGDKRVFLVGSGGIEAFISSKGYDLIQRKFEDSYATVNYKFTEDSEYKFILRLKDSILLSGDFAYANGTISIEDLNANLYSRKDNFVYLPTSDLSEAILQASITKEIAFWLWPFKGNPHPYAQYIVLDEIYPFLPPEQLMEAVEYLVETRLPFVISVMPIYENGEYPSMQRFCEVLRYAQANGGSIIMHSPLIQQEGDNVEQIWKYLTIATQAYTNLGIYPLGIEVPESYMFTETGREILKRYSTVFFYQNEDVDSKIYLEDRYNTILNDGHKMIAPTIELDNQGNSLIMVHPTALYLDLNEGMDSLKIKVNACIESDVPLKSLWEMDNVVYADNLYFYTEDGQAYLNNEEVSLEYLPFKYTENYDYENGAFRWIMKDLKGLNSKLVFIVVVSSVIFIIFIVIARQINKHKFLLPRNGDDSK